MEPSPKKSLIFKNYPDAFGDTYCVIGRVPFLYKTGPAWFQERYTWRLAREIRPVDHHHRIKPKWRSILRGIVAHFKQPHVDIPMNIISGLAYGGQGTGHGQPNHTFCELLVVIGIPPVDLDYDFEKIKEAAEYVQKNVVSEAGFPDVHVAVREWEYYPSVSTSSRTSKARLLPSLAARPDIQTMGYSHPFTTNPGLAVALLDKPAHEGTVGLYLQLKDPQGGGRSKILGLTCCHFTSPSSASTGLSIARAETRPEYIITPGEAVYTKGIWEFIGHIGAFRGKVRAAEVELEQLLKQEELKQKELKQQQRKQQRKQQKQLKANTDSPKPKAKGQRSTAESTSASASNARTATKSITSTPTPNPAIQSARRSISYNTAIVNKLNSIYERVPALSLDEAQNRRIGRVYYADPISASSEDPFDAYTVDWGLVEFDEGAFAAGFTGNKVFIGMSFSFIVLSRHLQRCWDAGCFIALHF
ncbi:hypothetical protein BJ165DRAFT_359443 [Panaeolus papilionaceus]|nr:hypothetical protein BJ165DRAFT_359443 [Panaeolus papilionaceus]